jgi:hypothetical protein
VQKVNNDRLVIKKKSKRIKLNNFILHHYYRPELIFLHNPHEVSGTFIV